MAVRGLGCPVRFFLTVGQAGDAPQAQPLIDGLPAEIVMADAAYDSDALRSSTAAKGAQAVIPNNPSLAIKYALNKPVYAERHLIDAASRNSSGSGAARPPRKDRPKLLRARNYRCSPALAKLTGQTT